MTYHIPQPPVNTPLSHASNVPHQQNGFLTNNNAALLHQDHLTASATLRCLFYLIYILDFLMIYL